MDAARLSTSFAFAPQDLARIARVLGVDVRVEGDACRIELSHAETGRRLSLEIRSGLEMPAALAELPPNVVSVYTPSSFLQLQGCTGFLTSDELGEVLFISRRNGVTSGLVVEREAACSIYAQVDERLLSTDFTELPPELAMSSVALSLAESLFEEPG